MKYQRRVCPVCKKCAMQIWNGRRGKYFKCPNCGKTLNKRPKKTLEL